MSNSPAHCYTCIIATSDVVQYVVWAFADFALYRFHQRNGAGPLCLFTRQLEWRRVMFDSEFYQRRPNDSANHSVQYYINSFAT